MVLSKENTRYREKNTLPNVRMFYREIRKIIQNVKKALQKEQK